MSSPKCSTMACYFYPRSPCGERRRDREAYVRNSLFLSTLSLRRATFSCFWCIFSLYISIHALLAESDRYTPRSRRRFPDISIHALLAESDFMYPNQQLSQPVFLSTLSLRRATGHAVDEILHHRDFYPRSPCGERRRGSRKRHTGVCDFYPRSPCGERQHRPVFRRDRGHFYPRSPCGERLRPVLAHGPVVVISIHALLAESDVAG